MAFWKSKKTESEPASEPAPVLDPEPAEPAPEPPAEPKPEPQRHRSEVMKLRLSPDELTYITEQAKLAGVSRTDYLVAAARGKPVIVINDVPKLLLELRREGVNLNQAVRLAHETGSVDLPELQLALQRCAEAQAEVVRMCDFWNMRLRQIREEVNKDGHHNNQSIEGNPDQGN